MTRVKGFTLLELMVVIAVIGVLASISAHMMGTYTKRSKFSEIVLAAVPVKRAIESCITVNLNTSLCDTWDKIGITQTQIMNTSDLIASLTIANNSAILTIVGDPVEVNGATYILTPNFNNTTNLLTWTYTGTCKTNTATRFC
ncbi:MAG: prepilin-type N-terminal cleavage/methylation domain-containing protein [Granulosicoccus sp.]